MAVHSQKDSLLFVQRRARLVHHVNIKVNNQVVNSEDCNPCNQPDENLDRANRECCGVINELSESGQNENDDFSVMNVTTIFDDDGEELKKLLNIGLGEGKLSYLKHPRGHC